MSDHTRAIVPIEAWAYSSPELRAAGRSVDPGLLAEALLYYESVQISVGNHLQFAELLQWFIAQNCYSDLLSLVSDGTITFLDYSFLTSAILGPEGYSIWNIQDPIQAQPGTFYRRYLYHRDVAKVVSHPRQRVKLYRAFQGRVVELKSDEFGPAIENARLDALDPDRNAVTVQAFVDQIFSIRKLGQPPEVRVAIEQSADGSQHHITWNVEFSQLELIAGKEIGFHTGTPLIGNAVSNRHLWAAAKQGCDLYLGQPMAALVGDKLFESAGRPVKTGAIIEDLKKQVEFPNIRRLVNDGTLTFREVLMIRSKARRFRSWLQSEADRDRDALLAYHHEVAKEAGLLKLGRTSLSLFGVLSGGAAGSVIGTVMAGPVGGAIGGAVGSGATYLLDVASKLGADWKPVVFGNWLRNRVRDQ